MNYKVVRTETADARIRKIILYVAENFGMEVALEKLEELPKQFEGVDKVFAIQAGREVRIMIKPEQVNDDKMIVLAREISQRIENEMEYPGQIKVHLIRESRAIDYAK